MSAELKPCPFCGGKVQQESYIVEACVFCTSCDARVRAYHEPKEDTGIAKSAEVWNTRVVTIPEGFVLVDRATLDDADRYRWLRDGSPRTSSRGSIGVFVGMGSVYAGFSQPRPIVLDQIVDLSMAGVGLNEIHERMKSRPEVP